MIDQLPDATRMGHVTLRTRDLDRLAAWYEAGPGLVRLAEDASSIELGVGADPLVRIEHAPALRAPEPHAAGLFHTAILYPDAPALAAAIVRLQQVPGGRFAGVGDHAVSQAFYFADPDGNGVELYVDRPRASWAWANGEVAMPTRWFDPAAFVREHVADVVGMPSSASVGHVHLQVGDVATARAFYVDALGWQETFDLAGQALFVSAGGYHHHMAMNVWNSAGAGRRADTLGLGLVGIVLPTRDAVGAASERLRARGVAIDDDGRTVGFDDPWGNRIRLDVERG